MVEKTHSTRYWALLSIGAGIGLLASFLQMLEKLALLDNKNASLACDISSVFSCSTVLSAPQSSLFGFPNSLICIVVFTTFLVAGLIGLTGGSIGKGMKKVLLGLAVFMLLFALWFLFTSTFVIGSICVFCLFCFSGLLLVNGAVWHLTINEIQLPQWLRSATAKHFDVVLLVTLAMIVVCMVAIRFYISGS
jgi:uncharacterized membrane protein